ncbi:DUF1801 domain-containing protein [Cohnella sp. CBP 2801]|uniref:DUF1801 domain-containing protein n=2 Tax=Cohnella zeiphila TaxID=2761120 RepID=A0A7X0VXV6_9BACL|nr:DUF1801 domain-containing protein [Cohnella zeiphila]MBB6732323.1 DUF1801 domain-containing protein [Cohnella zeiphila]
MEEVRKIVLGTGIGLSEHIKWNAPSFCVNGQDRITFNLHGKDGFRLIFHCGSKTTGLAGQASLFMDDTGLLEWVAGDRAIAKIASAGDLEEKRQKLVEVVRGWIEATKDL